jgi:hypothetical protein
MDNHAHMPRVCTYMHTCALSLSLIRLTERESDEVVKWGPKRKQMTQCRRKWHDGEFHSSYSLPILG